MSHPVIKNVKLNKQKPVHIVPQCTAVVPPSRPSVVKLCSVFQIYLSIILTMVKAVCVFTGDGCPLRAGYDRFQH